MLSVPEVAVLGLLGIVGFLIRVVVKAEYPLWGRLVADRICRWAGRVAKPRAAEWRSLLSERQGDHRLPCVLFAIDLMRASVRLRLGHTMEKFRRGSRWDKTYAAVFVLGQPLGVALLPFQIGLAVTDHLRWLNVALASYTALVSPILVVVFRSTWREITVKWAVWKLPEMDPSRLDQCFWTRSEVEAVLAIAGTLTNREEGLPLPVAVEPLRRYIYGGSRRSVSSG